MMCFEAAEETGRIQNTLVLPGHLFSLKRQTVELEKQNRWPTNCEL